MKIKSINFKSKKSEILAENSPVIKENLVPNKVGKFKLEKPQKKRRSRKKLLISFSIFFTILGILTALSVYFIGLPAYRVYQSANSIRDTFGLLASDLQNKNISLLDKYLGDVKNEIAKINSEIDRFDFLGQIEITRGYYENFQQAQVILFKTDSLITQTLPELKNLLQLSGFKIDLNIETPESEGKEGALTLILKELPQYINLYTEIQPKIEDILAEIGKLNPLYIPQVGGINFTETLNEVKQFSTEFPETSDKVMKFIERVPELIGSNKDTTYLVILQNETEMRSSGGLLTAFGTLKVTNGEIADNISLIDTWQLQYDMWRIGLPMPRNNIYGQSYLMNSGCGATEARVQDSAMYPDLNISMGYFKEYYDRVRAYFPEKYPQYDLSIIINYNFSENLLELVQPLEIEGFGTVNAENLYNFIKDETDNPENFYEENRKDIIKQIAEKAKERLLNLGLSEMPKVINFLVTSFQARDVALASKNKDLQAYFDEYGLSGRSEKDFNGDYFQFNEAQNCALKLNKFIRNTVDLNINIQDDGSINNSVKIKWFQPQIYNDSLSLQYSPTLQFSYRAWVRIFLPDGSTKINSDGLSRSGYLFYNPVTYFDSEMKKRVSDNIIQFDHRRFRESDPVERDEMNISWEVPKNINYNTNNEYRLLIQKHPGKSWGEKYNISINEKGVQRNIDFTLDRDKVVTLKNGIISIENYDQKLDWILALSNRIPWDQISTP